MPFYEYKVVPAPERAPKLKGLKGPAKFAQGLENLMNELAQDGWEYQRAESLPEEEKKGLMSGREIVTRTILVFRRELYFEENTGENQAMPEPAAPPLPPLSLARRAAPEAPGPADRAVPPTDEAETEDMDDIYAGAQADPEEPSSPRRPLVADRKGQGVDF